MEEEKKVEKKDNKNLICIIIVLCLLVLGLGGYIVYDKVLNNKDDNIEDNKREETKEDNIEDNKKEETKEENIEDSKREETKEENKLVDDGPVTDKFTVNLGTDSVGVYFVDNGDLYYLEAESFSDGRYFLLTHSGCLSDGSSEYCKGNPPYNKKPVKVEGISNVKKVKLFNGYKSGGESFQNYAITGDGKVYEINKNSATSTHYINVVDMIGDKENQVILVYKDGTKKPISEKYYGGIVEQE